MTEQSYDKFMQEHLRETTAAVATRLRKLADDVDRISKQRNLISIPADLTNALAWGFANLRAELPTVWLANMMEHEKQPKADKAAKDPS